MKVCCVPGCNNKHHGKGYCKAHYKQFVLKPRLANVRCRVPGCENAVSPNYTKEGLCEKHGTRLSRNGSVAVRKKERDTRSFIEAMAASGSPLDYEISNLNSLSLISKAYYGNYCHECGWDKGNCVTHHVIPLKNGGKNTLRNIMILCPNCHSLKHINRKTQYSEKFMAEMIELLKSF